MRELLCLLLYFGHDWKDTPNANHPDFPELRGLQGCARCRRSRRVKPPLALVGLALVFLALALPAGAQELARCGAPYQAAGGCDCFYLCRGLTDAGAELSCGPGRLPIPSSDAATRKSYKHMSVSFGNAGADCDPGTFTILWGSQPSAALPAQWHVLTTLTGVDPGQTSAWAGPFVPGPFWMSTFSEINDAQCGDTEADAVDVLLQFCE